MELRESATATADANGRAVATVQPLRAFESWTITGITVQSTSSTKVPTAKVYRGAEAPSSIVDGTFTGTLDHTNDTVELSNGERLICVWENADAGASCTMTVKGRRVV